MGSQNSALQTLVWTQIIQGSCSCADFESVDLARGLGVCISKKFPAGTMLLGLEHPLSSKVLENYLRNVFYIHRTIFCVTFLTIAFLIPSTQHKTPILKETSKARIRDF